MNDSVFEIAKSKRDQLIKSRDSFLKELNSVRQELDQVDKFLHMFEILRHNPEENLANFEYIKGTKRELGARRIKNSSKEAVADAAIAIITEQGRPVPRKQLLKDLDKRGLIINGENRLKVLSTMLWRMRDRVVSFVRVGYWIADMPWPEENFDPKEYFEKMEADRRVDDPEELLKSEPPDD